MEQQSFQGLKKNFNFQLVLLKHQKTWKLQLPSKKICHTIEEEFFKHWFWPLILWSLPNLWLLVHVVDAR